MGLYFPYERQEGLFCLELLDRSEALYIADCTPNIKSAQYHFLFITIGNVLS